MNRSEVERLRDRIRAQAPFLGHRPPEPTGWAELDQALGGGLPRGGLTVVAGEEGGGRTTLVARILAHRAREHRPVAWVDGSADLYPPALQQQGVPLERMLLVRAAPQEALSAYEQVLASGLFAAVAASGLDGALTPPRMRRVQSAVEGTEGMALWVLQPVAASRVTGAALQLDVSWSACGPELRVQVGKDRSGRSVGRSWGLEVPLPDGFPSAFLGHSSIGEPPTGEVASTR